MPTSKRRGKTGKEGLLLSRLRNIKHLALDTNCIAYHFEDTRPFSFLITPLFQAIEDGKFKVSAASLVLAEILPPAIESSNLEVVALYKGLDDYPYYFNFVGLGKELCEEAAVIRAKYRFGVADSLHLASALSAEAEVFITNDEKLKKFKEIKVLVLKGLLKNKSKKQ